MGRILGVDIGGSKIAVGQVDASGRVTAHSGPVGHPNGSAEETLDRVLRTIAHLAPDGPPWAAVGVGVAAQVDGTRGVARYAPNLRWKDVPVAEYLRSRLGCPVVVANDARSAAMAEWRFGAGAGVGNVLTVIVGTGVGGGAVVDGRLLGGAAGALGEIGHTALVAGGRPCHCPSRGCMEAYAGGWAIAERSRERVRADPVGGRRLVEICGSVDRLDVRGLVRAALEGDRLATSILRATSNYLSAGVAGLVNAFNPERVVLGGGVIDGWPSLVEDVARRARATCQPPAASAVSIVRSALGPDAVLIGAATFARDALEATGTGGG